MSAHVEQHCPECNRRTQHIAEDGIPICLACGYPRVKYDSEEGRESSETEHSQIMACLREDRKKGERGSSSSAGKKGDDKLGIRRLNKRLAEDEDVVSRRIEAISRRHVVLRVCGLEDDPSTEEIRAAIAFDVCHDQAYSKLATGGS